MKLRLAPAVLLRFLAKVKVDARGHWVWTGYTDEHGYGQFRIGGKVFWAHRVSYAVFRSSIRAGAEIDHACKCPSCINPRHLRKRAMAANRADVTRPAAVLEEVPF